MTQLDLSYLPVGALCYSNVQHMIICVCVRVCLWCWWTVQSFTDMVLSLVQVQDRKIWSTTALTRSAHTPFHTHTNWKSGAQITDNTVTPATCRAKPKFGPKYLHDLKAGIIITLLLWRWFRFKILSVKYSWQSITADVLWPKNCYSTNSNGTFSHLSCRAELEDYHFNSIHLYSYRICYNQTCL